MFSCEDWDCFSFSFPLATTTTVFSYSSLSLCSKGFRTVVTFPLLSSSLCIIIHPIHLSLSVLHLSSLSFISVHLFPSPTTESHARVPDAVRLHLQQQVLHRHLHHPLPQQEGSVCREDQEVRAQHLLPRVHRWEIYTRAFNSRKQGGNLTGVENGFPWKHWIQSQATERTADPPQNADRADRREKIMKLVNPFLITFW